MLMALAMLMNILCHTEYIQGSRAEVYRGKRY